MRSISANIPLLDHRADGDVAGAPHPLFGKFEILQNPAQHSRLGLGVRGVRRQSIQADDEAIERFKQPLALVQQRAVGHQQHGTELYVALGGLHQVFHVGAQQRFAAGEEDRIRLAADGAQKLDGQVRGQFLAEDVRLLLRAIGALQIAFVRGVEDRGVGSNDVGVQDFAAVKVLEIVFEILQDKRVVAQESPQKPESGRCQFEDRPSHHQFSQERAEMASFCRRFPLNRGQARRMAAERELPLWRMTERSEVAKVTMKRCGPSLPCV